jgi:hypothetical protein
MNNLKKGAKVKVKDMVQYGEYRGAKGEVFDWEIVGDEWNEDTMVYFTLENGEDVQFYFDDIIFI